MRDYSEEEQSIIIDAICKENIKKATLLGAYSLASFLLSNISKHEFASDVDALYVCLTIKNELEQYELKVKKENEDA